MTHKRGNVLFVVEQSEEKCAYCGSVTELRPYGRNRENICYDCGMKSENIRDTERQFDKLLDPDTDVVIQ